MTKVKDIKIYTTATCVYCKAEKEYLTKNKVAFTELHADTDQALAEELYNKSGQLGVPFTVITKEDGSEEGILGFDQPRLQAALGL